MPVVTVNIDGKAFRMACEDGQESHLEGLARHVDERIRTTRQSFGEIGDLRLTVMAALMICDELHELRQGMAEREKAVASREAALADASAVHSNRDQEIATGIDALSQRIERITRLLAGEEAE
jgi:cell division protein ZapA